MLTEPFTKERAEEKPLTVGDLIDLLSIFPRDLLMVEQRYSDLKYVTESEFVLTRAIKQSGDEWLREIYSDTQLTDEEKSKVDVYLRIEGN